MNKKANTVFFLIGATVLNLLIMVLLLALIVGFLWLVVIRNLPDAQIGPGLSMAIIIFILVATIGGTFFVYNRVIKWVVRKWDLERYIEPVFRGSRRNR